MKVSGYISIMLLVCFSVFLGHNLVPHHHHAEVVTIPLSIDCPIDHHDHHDAENHPEEAPVHCHAFNDVVFDTYSSPDILRYSRVINTLIVENDLTQELDLAGFTNYISIKIPDKSVKYFGSRSLRAPPCSV